jgi:hypothetical protein
MGRNLSRVLNKAQTVPPTPCGSIMIGRRIISRLTALKGLSAIMYAAAIKSLHQSRDAESRKTVPGVEYFGKKSGAGENVSELQEAALMWEEQAF